MDAVVRINEAIVLTRMREFFAQGSPWQRRLWGLSSPLMLQEVTEYARVLRDGQLSAEGLVYVSGSTSRQARRDLGLGVQERWLKH